MASNATANYALPQWEPDDRLLMADFNEAMHIIDDALHHKAQLVCGSYVGNGEVERTIALDATPKAVLVMSAHGEVTHYAATSKYLGYGGLAVAGSPVTANGKPILSVVEGGFKVYRENITGNTHALTNDSACTYNYIALL